MIRERERERERESDELKCYSFRLKEKLNDGCYGNMAGMNPRDEKERRLDSHFVVFSTCSKLHLYISRSTFSAIKLFQICVCLILNSEHSLFLSLVLLFPSISSLIAAHSISLFNSPNHCDFSISIIICSLSSCLDFLFFII